MLGRVRLVQKKIEIRYIRLGDCPALSALSMCAAASLIVSAQGANYTGHTSAALCESSDACESSMLERLTFR